jgi:hypothetical protein
MSGSFNIGNLVGQTIVKPVPVISSANAASTASQGVIGAALIDKLIPPPPPPPLLNNPAIGSNSIDVPKLDYNC